MLTITVFETCANFKISVSVYNSKFKLFMQIYLLYLDGTTIQRIFYEEGDPKKHHILIEKHLKFSLYNIDNKKETWMEHEQNYL